MSVQSEGAGWGGGHAAAESGAADAVEFHITREFDAPRELVWKAFSEPERIARWWGPKGFSLRVMKMEFRPGGVFHYAMHSDTGNVMWGKFVYGDIAAPDKVDFINSFSDEAGFTARAPFSETWPLEVMNTWTLTENGDRTTLNLRGAPVNATDEERAMFLSMHASMQQGFGGTFDQLDAYLKEGKS